LPQAQDVSHTSGTSMILGVSFACILGLFCLYCRSLLTLVRTSVNPGELANENFQDPTNPGFAGGGGGGGVQGGEGYGAPISP
jgi:hypothetical protein